MKNKQPCEKPDALDATARTLQAISETLSALLSTAGFSPQALDRYYYLVPIKNKKSGFNYYVRYYENGRQIPSQWNTYTRDKQAARLFAIAHRRRLLAEYHERANKKIDLYCILEHFYTPGSAYFELHEIRSGSKSPHCVSAGKNFITKTFIPYLKENNVRTYRDITAPLIVRLQDRLLLSGRKPQTVNFYLKYARDIFALLFSRGEIETDVFRAVNNLKVKESDRGSRGCYRIEQLAGIFSREWNNRLSRLLNMVIYTTNMRNSEIERISLNDIIEIEGCRFIDIKDSKTHNGIRKVPLHDTVYKEILAFSAGRQPSARVFLFAKNRNQSGVYRQACLDLAALLSLDAAAVRKERITYYSGRHFWKTLMSAHGLGGIDEYFMGHKNNSSDVSKRYDHKDKYTDKQKADQARAVFRILDATLFRQ